MKEALLISFAAIVIYYVLTKVQPHGLIFKLAKEDKSKEIKSENEDDKKNDPLTEGQELYNRGELRQSEIKFLEAIKQDSKSAEAYHFLGIIYLRQKMYKGAIEALEQAVKLNPLDDTSFNNLGLSYLNLEKYEDAVNNLEKSVSLNDKIAHRYLNLALAYQKCSNLEKAAVALESAIKIHPNTENKSLLAKNYLEMGDKKLSRKAIESVLVTDPDNSWAKRQLSSLDN